MVKTAYDEICGFDKEAYTVNGNKIILDAAEYSTRYGADDKVKNALRSVGGRAMNFANKHPKATGYTAALAAMAPGVALLGRQVKRANKFNKQHPELWERVKNGDPKAGKEYNKLWDKEFKKSASQR